VRGRVRDVVAKIRLAWSASAWAPLAGRGSLVLVALFVLAWIGRSATAAAPEPRISAPAALADAGSVALLPTPTASAVAPTPAPSSTSNTGGRSRATAEDPVYVNHAGVEDLRRLPGVGPKRADAIVALRQRMGRFQRVEDLLRVKGVGRTTLRKWRPLLRLDAPDAGAP
jgi:competence protein ComEA